MPPRKRTVVAAPIDPTPIVEAEQAGEPEVVADPPAEQPRRTRTSMVSSPMAEAPARRDVREELDRVEIWESLTDSTTWILVRDHINGGWKHQRVGGRGARRIQLTVEERRFNQDMVPDENVQLDPFVNGLLKCVQGEGSSPNAMDDAKLVALCGLPEDADFFAKAEAIQSEVLLRRLVRVAEKHASNPRYLFVRDLADTRYRVSKSQPSLDPSFKGEKLR